MTITTFLRDKFPKLYRRKLHAYCIGAAKTGTTSVASMFEPALRSAHEQSIRQFNHELIKYLEGQIDAETMAQFLVARDRQFNLDIESSHPMGYVSDLLAKEFPDAKFIITIREPLSWLRSRLNFHHRVDPPDWQEYRHYFWTSRQRQYNEQENTLEKYGICSLDIYLSQYADHYHRVLSAIPKERYLIVRTHELASSIQRIADFVGVDPKIIRSSHSNREDNKIRPLEEMDERYVKATIWNHCEPLIREYFPEKVNDYLDIKTP